MVHAVVGARAACRAPKLAAASFLINVLGLLTPLFADAGRQYGDRPSSAGESVVGDDRPLHRHADSLCSRFRSACRVAWLSARTGARLDALMSAEVLHHLVALPFRHFERTPSGIIAERLRQLDVLRSFLTGQMPVLAIDLLFVALFLIATFAISTILGLVAALAVPVLIGVSLVMHRAQRRLADESFQALAAKSSTLTETVTNAATIKALGARSRGREALADAGRRNRPTPACAPTTWPISRPVLRAPCSSWRRSPSS